MRIVAFANCVMSAAPWLTCLYPEAHVGLFIHTEGLLRLFKGHEIRCQPVDPPFKYSMPDLTPIEVKDIDAFIWSPLADEYVGISMLRDLNNNPYPIDSEESHLRFPPGPLYHEETLKLFWKELDFETQSIPKRFIITYPATHLTLRDRKERVTKLNETASELLKSRGWIHYELEDELAEDNYWSHFSLRSKQNLYKKIEADLNIQQVNGKLNS